MIETYCRLNGQRITLRYRKQFGDGDSFKGFIVSKSSIPFCCNAIDENLIDFEPQSLDDRLKHAIYKAIKKDQLRREK